MRVALTNAACLNTGDAAIALAIAEHVRKALGPEATVTVFDHQFGDAARYYPELEFAAPLGAALLRVRTTPWIGWRLRTLNLHRWALAAASLRPRPWLARALLRPREHRKLTDLAEFDLVLSTGGTYLVEHYSPWSRLAELEMLEATGTPVVLCTQSLGPFSRPELRERMRRVVDGSSATLVRDELSARNLEDLGADASRVHVLSDVVFTFADDDPGAKVAGPIQKVAVSVRSWEHGTRDDGGESYVDAVRQLLVHLVRERGVRVTMLSTCQGIPEYWTDDSAYAQDIVLGLPDDVRQAVAVDSSFHDPRALLAELGRFDLVVSTRMHMAILALCAGVPVLPIAYEFKTVELFQRLGLGAHVQDIDTLQGPDLVEALQRFLDDEQAIQEALTVGVQRERRRADEAIAHLAHAVTPGRDGAGAAGAGR